MANVAVDAAVPPEHLRWRCDPAQLGFASTDEVQPMEAMVGQERGLEAIELGLDMEAPGYNVYVAGPSGTGRSTAVYSQVERAIADRAAAVDWAYLHNFADPYQPIALQLPAGRARQLVHDLDGFINTCRQEIPKVFESEQFEKRRLAIVQTVQHQHEALFSDIADAGERLGFVVQLTPQGIMSAPALKPGDPMSPEAYELLPDDEKAELRGKQEELQRKIDESAMEHRRIDREGHQQLHLVEREAALSAVGHLLEDLRRRWADQTGVLTQLNLVQEDLLEHVDAFRGGERPQGESLQPQAPSDRYQANAFVTHDPSSRPPVVFEPNPTYYNLVGRITYRAAIGAMHTDFTLISPGALHRANGGVLVLQARDVLINPFAWDALKRSLRDGEIRVENLGEQMSSFPTATLKPQPIPLRVKVVLIGDLPTYMLLYRLDDDFQKLFRIKAHFGHVMDRSPEAIQAYSAFISGQARSCGLPSFDADAVARIIEQAARAAEDQGRLSTRFETVTELMTEAGHRARQAGADRVSAQHVEETLAAQERRVNLIEDEVQRLIQTGTIAIDTTSAAVGQVNGLSVMDLGDHAFARPSRITARVGLGTDGVVNIEREVELSGPTHSKGVLILSGYLLGKYGHDHPLALSARVTFEQVYSAVDGDSASSAELYALLSCLSELPIKQGIAVTGAVNQLGEVEAIGGVTTKIEGHFAVCKAQGLTGEQGVIIPDANLPHLMLKQEVVDAVANKQFNIWAVHSVDQGIEILTGVPAGQCRPDGYYPDRSVHSRVQRRLSGMAARLTRYANGQLLAPRRRSLPLVHGNGRSEPTAPKG